MYILKVCAVCFTTEGKLYNLEENNLRADFNSVSCLNTYKNDGLPYYLCMVCAAQVKRFKNFQTKCQKSNYILTELLYKNKQITMREINAIDRKLLNLQPTLSFCDPKTCVYKEIKFQWVKFNRNLAIQVKDLFVRFVTTFDEIENPLTEAPVSKHVKVENVFNEESSENDTELNMSLDTPNEDVKEDDLNIYFDNDIPCDETLEIIQENLPLESIKIVKEDADGCSLNVEYANVSFISQDEQRAVAEINSMFSSGKYKCMDCNKGFNEKSNLAIHRRIHETITCYRCDICNYYYKSKYLLKVHMSDKHFQKFMCPKCPEVNFDRKSAKLHYARAHLSQQSTPGYTAPRWLNKNYFHEMGSLKLKDKKINIKTKKIGTKPVKKKIPSDFLKYSPIGHNEQYDLVRERQLSKNYIESLFKCNNCFRGFREINTFNNHIKKHNPALSGPLQCDICQLYFHDKRKMYKHMIITHLFKYTCQMCNFVCYNRAQAQMHYRWHKNVTYSCPHCDKTFFKASTQLTHIRLKHPSTAICNMCGHSFVSDMGLYFHKQKAHSKEEVEMNDTDPDPLSNLYCQECDVQFISTAAFDVHLRSSNKHSSINLAGVPPKLPSLRPPKDDNNVKKVRRARRCKDIINNGLATATDCEACGVHLANDVIARKHYKSEHPGIDFLKRYMCDVCGHTTQQYNNLLVHMRTHTNEKPYACNYCGRRFSMPSNRDRHLVVHTGEKRYECHHCHRKFTQSSAVKLHIQTVHLKIPYAPWDKKNRKRRKELETNMPQPEPKFQIDNHGQYLNAYISYHDEG